ncbi:MAG: deoxyribose-phosphate aldolase [Hungatella sp.]|jgi:deoxyribose-phosphate aldolase|nr:deoxyribose-phosphate aldolase [Hungatella sp.]
MLNEEILNRVDHTALSATAAWEEIKKLCKEGIENKTASVCIPPSFVSRVSKKYGKQIAVCTVIGFPLGYSTTAVKVFEAGEAARDGADEIDMVINLGDVKDGNFDKITEEIKAVKEAIPGKLLKVIIETCYLTGDEKVRLCQCVTEGGADYIKTSTGFGTKGAELADIPLFRANIRKDVKIKAAGGIRTAEDLERFAEAGCDRIGSSTAVKLLRKKQ